MDTTCRFSKILYFTLALHSIISDISSSTLQPSTRDNIGKNPATSNSIYALPNNSLEEKTSRFQRNLDECSDWIESSDAFSALDLPKRTLILQKISFLKSLTSLKPTNSTLFQFFDGVKDLNALLNPLPAAETDETKNIYDTFVLLYGMEQNLSFQMKIKNEVATLQPVIDECIDEIIAYRFESAEKKLLEIGHEKRINLVVRKLYGSGRENFYTLLNWAESFKNYAKNAILLYEALYDEIRVAGDENLFDLLLLVRRVLKHRDKNLTLEVQYESLLANLSNSTRVTAIDEISNAFILDKLAKIEPYVLELAETGIQDMNAVIESTMNRISGKLATSHLSSVILANKGLCVNETESTPLTFRLKRVLSWTKYCSLSPEVKKLAQRAVNSTSVSIGLGPVEYCNEVCIKNAYLKTYLYDPDISECSDDSQRNDTAACPVYATNFQSLPRSILVWNLKSIGDNKYHISSYANNYSLFVDDEKLDDNRRIVSTRQAGQDDDRFEWQFESDGDFVYIKNIRFGEYLSASVRGSVINTRTKLRNVFTLVRKKLTPDCCWTIVECPQVR